MSRSEIEEMLELLTQRVRDIEAGEQGDGGGGIEEVADSGRAESITSDISSVSCRENAKKVKEVGECQSTLRRQSVIIEGLTIETEELRNKCEQLEDKVNCGAPILDHLSQKLQNVESRLEESDNYCYQVVEENVEMKSKIETLEAEISEVEDTFREADAKELKKKKREVERLGKTCRSLQIQLGKAQAAAGRLKQEKLEGEELGRRRGEMIWKTTALVAGAAMITRAA